MQTKSFIFDVIFHFCSRDQLHTYSFNVSYFRINPEIWPVSFYLSFHFLFGTGKLWLLANSTSWQTIVDTQNDDGFFFPANQVQDKIRLTYAIFPRFPPLTFFPALVITYTFSRAFDQIQVFRTCNRLRVFPRFTWCRLHSHNCN